jgi:hypothetical protein
MARCDEMRGNKLRVWWPGHSLLVCLLPMRRRWRGVHTAMRFMGVWEAAQQNTSAPFHPFIPSCWNHKSKARARTMDRCHPLFTTRLNPAGDFGWKKCYVDLDPALFLNSRLLV